MRTGSLFCLGARVAVSPATPIEIVVSVEAVFKKIPVSGAGFTAP